MLADRYHELLTAYVDGELGARQRKAVLRLLRRSAEARGLLRQLQDDAAALRRLPRPRLGEDFPSRVLQAVRNRRLHPGRPALPRLQPRSVPVWVGVALAASILLLVGLSSYLYFAQTPAEQPDSQSMTQNGPPRASDEHVQPGPDQAARPAPGPKNNPQPPKEPQPSDLPKPSPPDVAAKPEDKPETPRSPASTPGTDSVLTQPVSGMEMFQPGKAEVTLPVILKIDDLDVAKLKAELLKDSGFRVEMPCRESVWGLERLQAAFKANGFTLLIEQVAQARLKQPKLRTNFVLYAEDLTPDELAKVLQLAGSEDKKAEAKKKGDGQFNGIVLTRMNKDDRKELGLLGVEDKSVQGSKPSGPLGVDPRKPLSETTGDQVVQALAGQGSTGRAEAGKPAVKAPERLVLVLPYNPDRPRPGSPEVKHFLDNRKPPRAGTIQVLLVLREPKG
jgi:hypothetical protein